MKTDAAPDDGKTRIEKLAGLGQSVWLDYLDREFIARGKLAAMIDREGLRGATSNPTIFQKAIARSSDYDALIRSAPSLLSEAALFEEIEIREVTWACDLFRNLYNRTDGADGFVSIEVSPVLARKTSASIDEARRLWALVARPNVMIKLPGTREGLPAIERCLAEGINVNITLLFSVERYREVVEAYQRALERRVAAGGRIDHVASVASFFVSRVDTKIDGALASMAPSASRAREGGVDPEVLRGKAAIANAQLAYEAYTQSLATDRWRKLASQGAKPQRVLWASTSTKDPAYPPLYYAEALVGQGTVDTMTLETLSAYESDGRPEVRLGGSTQEARRYFEKLETLGIDFDRATRELEDEGIEKFVKSFDEALEMVGQKRRPQRGVAPASTEHHGPAH